LLLLVFSLAVVATTLLKKALTLAQILLKQTEQMQLTELMQLTPELPTTTLTLAEPTTTLTSAELVAETLQTVLKLVQATLALSVSLKLTWLDTKHT
tara:strand:+ start:127 stop:417 length:291 start_codon:yes stop_codon:yes gene_type:complete